MKLIIAGLLTSLCLTGAAFAAPKIAVTDLSYEERVQEYFHVVAAHSKSSLKASASHSARDSDFSSSERGRSSLNAKSESSYYEAEGTYSYIERGELRKFTADVKGEMLKSGIYRVTTAKPYTAKNMEKLYDVIARIKQGMYPGADYVLFGSVSSIQWRDEINPIQGANKYSQTLSLELVADFNLINTKTYEIKAAFSAMGEGQDAKFLTGNNRVVMNRGKVVSEVSKSLGLDAARQLEEQFDPSRGAGTSRSTRESSFKSSTSSMEEEVIILR